MSVMLNILEVDCSYGSARVLDGITFNLERGSFTGIIGPNGSGKSTLLRCISRVMKPVRGIVMLDESDLYGLDSGVVAKKMAVVPQETSINFPFTVEEVVLMGRSPHLGNFQGEGEKDYAIAEEAMELTGTRKLGGRLITAISGGERQRVIIAKALAQEPEIILLDEPTSHLDINHQLEVLNLLQRLNREKGLTIVSIFHDLNLASQYCGSLILMKKGQIHSLGTPEVVVTASNIKDVYGARVLVKKHPVSGHPTIMFSAQARRDGVSRGRVHVICGGGAGAAVLGLLFGQGFEVSTGVLNTGDIDWEAASFLGLEMAEEVPFSLISEHSHLKNLDLIKKSDACILVGIPFGHGNLKNLEALDLAYTWGKPVVLIEEQDIAERDFTGGHALQLYNSLKEKGAVVLRETVGILPLLDELIKDNRAN